MAINDVTGEWVYQVRDILHEFLGHNFVCGLRALKPKRTNKAGPTSRQSQIFPSKNSIT